MRSWDWVRRWAGTTFVVMVVGATTAGALAMAAQWQPPAERDAARAIAQPILGARAAFEGSATVTYPAAGVASPAERLFSDAEATDTEDSDRVAPRPPASPPAQVQTAPQVLDASVTTEPAGSADSVNAQLAAVASSTTTTALITTTTSPSATTTTSVRDTTTTTAAVTTTTAPEPPGAVVRVDGKVYGAGFSGETIAQAAAGATPGTVFEFEPGTHRPLRLDGVRGTAEAPLRFVAADPQRPPEFSSGDLARDAGLHIRDSDHVVVSGFTIRESLWGARIERSSNVELRSLTVRRVGQEGIRILDRSSWVTIADSSVSDTGLRPGTSSSGQPFSRFGEGIYIGTGDFGARDHVQHVTITGTDITRTTSEAIDVKAPASDVTIRSNRIHDIVTNTSGAIVVHLHPDHSVADAGIVIESNEITDISTNSGHRDGVGIVLGSSGRIAGNTISRTAHYGIRIEDGGVSGGNITAEIQDNNFAGIGLANIKSMADRASVQLSGNT